MKNFKSIALVAVFVISCSFALAQEDETYTQSRSSKWISPKGFWVIESNVKTPKNSVVHFYDNGKQLLSSVSVVGKRLNPERRKTLKNLKKVLEQVVEARETAAAEQQQQQWVAILTR